MMNQNPTTTAQSVTIPLTEPCTLIFDVSPVSGIAYLPTAAGNAERQTAPEAFTVSLAVADKNGAASAPHTVTIPAGKPCRVSLAMTPNTEDAIIALPGSGEKRRVRGHPESVTISAQVEETPASDEEEVKQPANEPEKAQYGYYTLDDKPVTLAELAASLDSLTDMAAAVADLAERMDLEGAEPLGHAALIRCGANEIKDRLVELYPAI